MDYQEQFTEALQPIVNFFANISTLGKLIQLAIAIFTFVSMWIVYSKAGQGGWKLLIPIYGDYIRFKIAHCAGRFWANLFFPTVSTVLIVVGLPMFFSSGTAANTGVILVLLGLALILITAVIRITVPFKMAAAFNCSGAFGLGLWLLPTIFYAILAFNKSIVYGQKETIYGSL